MHYSVYFHDKGICLYRSNYIIPVKNPYTGKQCSASVYLQCDEDNCHTAYKSTERFLSFYNDKDTFEKKILEAVADDLADNDGTITVNGLW